MPLLELDDGTRITEGPAIVQYIADKVPAKNLAPANGTLERIKLQSWLNFVTSELHKGFSPLFNPAMPDEAKKIFRERLATRFAHLDKHLASNDYLMGKNFSVADAYLFVVSNWAAARRCRSVVVRQRARLSQAGRRAPRRAGGDEGGRAAQVAPAAPTIAKRIERPDNASGLFISGGPDMQAIHCRGEIMLCTSARPFVGTARRPCIDRRLLAAAQPAQSQTTRVEIARGKYLVQFGGCIDCHTPGYFFGKPDMPRALAGSEVGFEIPGLGVFYGPNLTPDKETGLGNWTKAQIVTALQKGTRPDGRSWRPIMPWQGLRQPHQARRQCDRRLSARACRP